MTRTNKKHYIINTKKILSPLEIEALHRVCNRSMGLDGSVYPERRNGLIFLIMLETGIRAQELLNLKISDFSAESATIFVESLKGSNPREIPLKHSRARELKQLILQGRDKKEFDFIPKDQRIFDITYARLGQIWGFYRPNPEKVLHSLRHTFAVQLYQKTKNIKVVQLALGHRNINNTLVYLDFCYAQFELRKLMHG